MKSILLVLFLGFSPFTFADSQSCGPLFKQGPKITAAIDTNYGHLNQNDPRFKAAGLFPQEGSSMLCGPVCAYNIFAKIFKTQGVFSDPAKAPAQVRSMMFDILKEELGYSAHRLINNGVRIDTLAYLAAKVLEHNHVPAKITVSSAIALIIGNYSFVTSTRINLTDFKLAAFPNNATIIGYGHYKTYDAREADPSSNRDHGHYLVVSGYDTVNPMKFYVIDPMKPDYERAIYLEPVNPAKFEAPTYRMRYENGTDNMYIIEDVINIQL